MSTSNASSEPQGIQRFATSRARDEVSCPRCGAQPGSACRKPSGVKAQDTHTERLRAYHQWIGAEEYARRHGRGADGQS